jgi:glycosyltransferase involved in cell wall biosynthesis
MACGVPIVATRSGGIVEVVEDRKTGLLVPPLDPTALADAVQQLGADLARRRAMGEAGRERVLTNFTVEASVNDTIRIYQSLGIAGFETGPIWLDRPSGTYDSTTSENHRNHKPTGVI